MINDDIVTMTNVCFPVTIVSEVAMMDLVWAFNGIHAPIVGNHLVFKGYA